MYATDAVVYKALFLITKYLKKVTDILAVAE